MYFRSRLDSAIGLLSYDGLNGGSDSVLLSLPFVQYTKPDFTAFMETSDYAGDTTTTGTVTVNGAAETGSITDAADHDWFAIDIIDGQIYTLDGDSVMFLDIEFALYDQDGNFLLTIFRDMDPTGLEETSQFQATYTGQAFLALSPSNDPPGPIEYAFTVTASEVPEDDFADDTSTTGFIAADGSASGTLGETADDDWFAVTFEEGQSINFETGPEVVLTLYNENGNNLNVGSDTDFTTYTSLYYTSTTGGQFYISATVAGSSTPFNYTITATSGSQGGDSVAGDSSTTATVELGGSIVGSFDFTNDEDWYAIELEEGQTFRLEGDNGGAEEIRIYDQDGSDYGTLFFQDPFTAPAPGTYFIALRGVFDSRDNYNLNVVEIVQDVAGDSSTTGALSEGDSLLGYIDESNSDFDWYQISVNRTDTERFTILVDDASTYEFEIYRLSGNRLSITPTLFTTVDGQQGLQIDMPSNLAGAFYLSVSAFIGNVNNDDYIVSYLDNDDDYENDLNTATNLVVDGAVLSGVFDYVGDEDWVAVTAEAGDIFEINLHAGSSSLTLSIFDANGNIINAPVNMDGNDITTYLEASTAGTYYVSLTGDTGNVGASYTLSATTSSDQQGSTIAGAGDLPIYSTVEGAADYLNDRDVFRLSVNDGLVYALTGRPDTMSVSLFDSDGNSVNFTHFNGDIYYEADFTGDIYVAFEHQTHLSFETGEAYSLNVFTLRDDYGDSAAEAGTAAVDGVVYGTSHGEYDSDWFQLDIAAGDIYAIGLFSDDVFQNTMALRDANGNIVSQGGALLAAGLAAGTYYIDVSVAHPSALSFSQYTLGISQMYDEAPTGTSTNLEIAAGDSVTGFVIGAADEDWYYIDVNANQEIIFEAGDISGVGLIYSIYDDNGTLIDSINGGTYQATFTEGGRYYVAVSQTFEGFSEYSLTWFDPSSSALTYSGSTSDDTIIGDNGDSTILGFQGNDYIAGWRGNDVITTGLGGDIVDFRYGHGHDIVTDFTVGLDTLSLNISSMTRWHDFMEMVTETADGVRITLNGASSITLQGVSLGDLHPGMFIFSDGDDNGFGPFVRPADYTYSPKSGSGAEKPPADPPSFEDLDQGFEATSALDDGKSDLDVVSVNLGIDVFSGPLFHGSEISDLTDILL